MNNKESNVFYAPYYIFIKGLSNKDDLNILKWLQLEDYYLIEKKLNKKHEDIEFSIYITELDDWICVMDNFFYNLWNKIQQHSYEEQIDLIGDIGEKYDLFSIMMGDVDGSLEFFYYKDGKLKRKFIYDEHINGEINKIETYGLKLSGERQKKDLGKYHEYALGIAKSVGINPNFRNPVRLYGNLEQKNIIWG